MSTSTYGGIRNQKMTPGACRKCGFPGHLPFQCYNFLRPNVDKCADISSTSSESDYETPLTAKDENRRKMKRKSKQHHHHKDHKRRKRSCSTSTTRKSKKEREKRHK